MCEEGWGSVALKMCPLHVHMTTQEIWGFWTFCEVIGWVFLHGVAVMFHWLIREAGGKCEKHMWAETWESLHQYKGWKWDFWLHCTSCLKELQQRARPKPWQHQFPHSLCSEQPCMTDPLIHCRPSHSASTDLQTTQDVTKMSSEFQRCSFDIISTYVSITTEIKMQRRRWNISAAHFVSVWQFVGSGLR